MHHVDRDTPWDELWQAMGVLIDQGKVLYVGSSNFAGWHIADANAAAASRNMLGLVSEQSIYNLMIREVELEVLPAARKHGVGIIPWSPLQGGLLGGVLAKQGIRRQVGRSVAALEANRDRIEAYEKLSSALGENPANVGLAWLLHQEGVTAPIIGPRTLEQLDESLRAVELKLVDETLVELDRLFPGYKPAPEHYAW
jgi:aryl-alcohol dehydrogenase-like predicted oxidoreductase